MKKLYRYVETYEPLEPSLCFNSNSNNHIEYSVKIHLQEFDVLRETKCGVWIESNGIEKFVNLNKHKKFALETKEEAMESFILRKKAQVRILSTQLKKTQEALCYATREAGNL